MRGENQEHHNRSEREGEPRGAAGALLLKRRAAPVETHIAGQGLFRDAFHFFDRLSGTGAWRTGTNELHGGEIVETIKTVRAGGVFDFGKSRNRHHCAAITPDEDATDIVGAFAVDAIGRHQYLPGATVLVEVVDVVSAQGRGHRVESAVDWHTEGFGLVAINVDIELR